MQMNNNLIDNSQEREPEVNLDTSWGQPDNKTSELKNALEISLDEMHEYFWEMKKEMEEKLWKDDGYNEHKDYLSDKYALAKTIEKYWYDTVMKQAYFKDIKESVDNRDDYLSERWEEIEDF